MSEFNTKLIDDTITQGNVKITLMRGGKEMYSVTAHNTGTLYLCEYIAAALTGDYVIAKRPGIIVPFTKGTGDNIELAGKGSPYTESKVVATASYWDNKDDGGFCTTEITFLIPSANVAGVTIDGFLLLSKDSANSRVITKDKIYARVDLSEPITPLGDVNLKVIWTLYVCYRWDIDRSL